MSSTAAGLAALAALPSASQLPDAPAHAHASVAACAGEILDDSARSAALWESLTRVDPESLDDSDDAGGPIEALLRVSPSEQRRKLEILEQLQAIPDWRLAGTTAECRRSLLVRGESAAKALLGELRRAELGTSAGFFRAERANSVLRELAGGHFGWSWPLFDAANAEFNGQVVASWTSWLGADRETRVELRDLAEFSGGVVRTRTIEGTPLRFIDNELVLEHGDTLEISTHFGTLVVCSGPGLERTFEWNHAMRSVVLDPRADRWDGSLGAYFPGPGNHWEPHCGVTRAVIGEGQQHFDSEDQALAWLRAERGTLGRETTIYRDDGLAIAASIRGNTLDVHLWQIVIDGRRPTRLDGSRNEMITGRP